MTRAVLAFCIASLLGLSLLAGACGFAPAVWTPQAREEEERSRPGGASHAGGIDGGRQGRGDPAVVMSIVDGDTIHVRYHGRDLTVRLIGLDTPETVDPSLPVQCYGEAASSFTEQALSGEPIRLGFDVQRLDQYGRTLAYVWQGGRLFNEQLVAEGFAVAAAYPPNVRYLTRFQSAERVARARALGLWGACGSERTGGRHCDPAYPDVCIPSAPPDLDCADIPFRSFRVRPPDPQRLDGDHNRVGCEP